MRSSSVKGIWLACAVAVAAVNPPNRPMKPSHVTHSSSSITMQWFPPVSQGGVVDGYEVQFKKQGTLRANTWTTVPKKIAGVVSTSRNPVQTVTCRSGFTGTFQLALNSHGINGFDSESKSLTARINCDAGTTQDVMQQRLQALENVGCVHVEKPYVDAAGDRHWKIQFRSDITPVSHLNANFVKTTTHATDLQPISSFGAPAETKTFIGATNHNGYQCPASSHGSSTVATLTYPWTATHTGSWPMLIVKQQGAIAAHTQKVYAHRDERPGAHGRLCKGSSYDSDCTYTAAGLQANKYYLFRTRAHNKYGWSAWSGLSDPVLTVEPNGESSTHWGAVTMQGGIKTSRFPSAMDTHVSL